MKNIKQAFRALLLFAVSVPAFADSVTYSSIHDAAQNSGDLSRQALTTIFGDVVTSPLHPTGTTTIGAIFGILNGVLCALALFWFLTVTLKGLVKSGAEGRVFGNARTMMAPVMSLGAFITLVPTGSGWSLAQLLMLWAASIMGVGSANLLTNKAVDMLSSGHSLVSQPVAPDTRHAAHQIFEMNLCKYAINQQLQAFYRDSGAASTAQMTTTGGHGSYTTGNGSAICGSAKIPTTTRSSSWSLMFDAKVDTASIEDAQKSALDTMQQTLDQAAEGFVTGYLSKRDADSGSLPDAETVIQQAAATYENTINGALHRIDYGDSLQSSLTSNIKAHGWAALGAWYQTFATANAKTSDVAASAPKTSGPTGMGEQGSSELYDEVFAAYRAQLQNSSYTPPAGTQTSLEEIKAGTTTDPKSVFVGLFGSPMQQLVNLAATTKIGQASGTGDQLNPLLKMKAIGDYTLDVVGTALTGYVGVQLTTAIAGNNIVGRTLDELTGWKAVIVSVLRAIAPPFYFLLFVLFSVGFSLGVLLPAIPFIFWMVGLTNWIASVLIGCAAGSMWSATHLGAEEDRGSRAAYGYIFLIDMMLRPSLMVLGFFFASVTIIAAGTLLNALFASALANAQVDSFTGLFEALGWLLVYSQICTQLVTKVFSLVVTLPDYVINFLGGRDGANILGGLVESTTNMFASFGSGAHRVPGIDAKERAPGNNEDGIK